MMNFKFPKIDFDFKKPGRVRGILLLFFVVLAVGLLIDIAVRIVNARISPAPAAPTAQPASTMAAGERKTLDAYRVIWERNLLETTDQETAVDASMDLNNLQATRLQLDLLGTVAGDETFGFAVVEERDKKKQRLVKIGDTLANATVLKIMRNAIVLRVGDRDEVLKMKKREETGVSPGRADRGIPRLPVPEPREPGAPPSPEGIGDLANILTQARIAPHISVGSSGKPDGVIISNIQPGSILQNIGLSNGDIIQEINSRAISNPADLLNVYREMKPGSTITVKVKRMGREMTLNYNME